MDQVDWAEAAVKYLQVALGGANFTQIKHEDEFTMIFDQLSVLQEGVLQNIRTMTQRVYNMEDSTLTGLTYQGYNHMEALVEHILELEKYRI